MFRKIYASSRLLPSDDGTLLLSFRIVKYFLVWLTVWQENVIFGSPIQIGEIFTWELYPLRPFEFLLIVCGVFMLIEHHLMGDHTVRRSYFYGPLITIALSLFMSWARGSFINQQVAIVYEVHEAIITPFAFFVFLNMFRDSHEWRVVLILIILGTIAKSADGLGIYLFSDDAGKAWGTLLLWRDGYLLAIGVTSMVLLLYYNGQLFRWLKITMITSTPLIVFALITSYRRTFFIAILINLIVMFFVVGKGNRLKHLGVIVGMVTVLFAFILATDPIGFLTRIFAGVLNPKEEGSAYIRLMELPNVLLNIYHNPMFGTAIGTEWHQYIRMPLFANFTTLGTHNSYLYWPLRGGIFLTIGFWWMMVRMWKVVALQMTFAKNLEDKLLANVSFFMLVTYMVGSFFGLMYGDVMTILTALHMVSLQLFIEDYFGKHTIKNVVFFKTLRTKTLHTRY